MKIRNNCIFNLKNISTSEIFSLSLFAIKIGNPMNRIKEVLAERGIKQTWLAEKLGKSYNMVNSYVHNRRQPSLEVLNKIAEILNIDVRELIKSTR